MANVSKTTLQRVVRNEIGPDIARAVSQMGGGTNTANTIAEAIARGVAKAIIRAIDEEG